ncbi:MAG TPA: protein kinase [Polyangia bacterium]|nr:protein kinase [Polyangia bacterium]
MTGQPLSAPTPAVGDEVDGKYRLTRLLGQGVLGMVFEAENQLLGRKVALRFMHPHLRSEVSEGRFLQETRAVGGVGHDNITELLDVAKGTSFGPYAVMEMVDGESLAATLTKQGALPLERAIDVMAQVLSALDAAHAAGVVCRDLKPENIVLTARAGRTDFVKLLDFGLSKPGAGNGSVRPYLAPEQLSGAQSIDGRADIYSAGVVLYQVLTGQLPSGQPPAAPTAVRSDLPHGLDGIVLHALQPEPSSRWQTARELREALRSFTTLPLTRPTGVAAVRSTPHPDAPTAAPLHAAVASDPAHAHAEAQFWGSAHDMQVSSLTGEWDKPPMRRGPIIVVASLAAVVLFGGLGYMISGRGVSRSERPSEFAKPAAASAAAPKAAPQPATPAAPAAAPAGPAAPAAAAEAAAAPAVAAPSAAAPSAAAPGAPTEAPLATLPAPPSSTSVPSTGAPPTSVAPPSAPPPSVPPAAGTPPAAPPAPRARAVTAPTLSPAPPPTSIVATPTTPAAGAKPPRASTPLPASGPLAPPASKTVPKSVATATPGPTPTPTPAPKTAPSAPTTTRTSAPAASPGRSSSAAAPPPKPEPKARASADMPRPPHPVAAAAPPPPKRTVKADKPPPRPAAPPRPARSKPKREIITDNPY